MRSVVVRCRHHLHGIGHFQSTNERHRSAARVARCGRRGRHHGSFSFDLGRLVRREDRYAAPHRRMVRRFRCVRVQLLRGTGRIRSVVVVGRRWSLRGRLVLSRRRSRRHRGRVLRARRSRIAARRVVLPHVDPALRGARQLSDVVDGVVRPRVRVVTTALAHQLALRQKTTLGTVARHRAAARPSDTGIVPLLHIVIRRCVVHSYKIWPTNLRRRARVRSAHRTGNSKRSRYSDSFNPLCRWTSTTRILASLRSCGRRSARFR